jgi:hypothetical protein
MKKFKCVECGVGTVTPTARRGRVMRYRQIDVEVPATLAIRTCDNCGEEYVHASEAKAIDEALEVVYRETVRQKLVAALVALEPLNSMSRIERVLPLSEGYLSKLKQGRAVASPQIVSTLCLLATSPHSLEALEALWAVRPGERFGPRAEPKPAKTTRRPGAKSKRAVRSRA